MSTSQVEREELLQKAKEAMNKKRHAEMTEEQREKRRQYLREWRAKNPDKVRRHQEDYLLRQYEKMQQRK